jgi:hypothetical protein
MGEFIHDSITVKVRLLTSTCPDCGLLEEIQYVPSELAQYNKDLPTFRAAEQKRDDWDASHAQKCTRVPALLSAS